MKRRTTLMLGAILTAIAGIAPMTVQAQPIEGPLRIVVGYAPGGSSDRVARIVGEKLQAKLGIPVIVENKTGAGGRLAAQQVKATPAGQSVLMLANPAVMVVAPLVFKDSGYDPERDFTAVSQVNDYEFGLAVATAVPVRELSHLLAWLRSNPEKANFGVPATGSLPHFFALMTAEKAGVPAQVVGYRGSGPLLTDLIGGQVPVAFDTLDTLLPQFEAGKLRILATSGTQRALKTIPTFQEAGMKLSATGWNVAFAKTAMPAAQADRIAREIAAVMALPEVRDKFLQAKSEPVSASREATRKMLADFSAQWVPVIQQAKLQFD